MSARKRSYVIRAIGQDVATGRPLADALLVLAEDSAAGGGGYNVPTVAALSALDTTALQLVSGANVRVLSLKAQWDLDLSDTTTPADAITVALATPAGRWHRRQTPDPYWQVQAAWFVNSLTGSDENPGTVLLPIRSLSEFVRRTGQTFEPSVNVVVTITGAVDGYVQTVLSKGATLTIRGALPTPVADVVAASQAPAPVTQHDPQVTLTTGWATFTKKANLLSFPASATPSWAMAFDNDGALATQITFPTTAAGLPSYNAVAMPAPGDPVLIYPGANFASITNLIVTGSSSHPTSPAVIFETLKFSASYFDGHFLQSRCIWDDATSSIELTRGFAVLVEVVQEITDGASYGGRHFTGVIEGSWFSFFESDGSTLSLFDTSFKTLESVQSETIMYRVVLCQDFAGVGGNYAVFSSLTEVHVALWGTPVSAVVLYQDSSIYVDGGPTLATFHPTNVTVGNNGTPIPPLVPGAVVPLSGALILATDLYAAPFSGSAIEYMRNCRVLPS